MDQLLTNRLMCTTVLVHIRLVMNPELLFTIHTGSAEPIYRQLVDQMRRRVASGHLLAGQEIPSVRELAQALAVHPMTVSKAFGLMEAEGLIERRRGLSMIVASRHMDAQSNNSRVELLRPILEKAATESRQLKLSSAESVSLFRRVLQEGEST